jgi:hypothetical protein
MSFDEGQTLADRMRAHASDGHHLYAELMRAMADDWEAGGPVRDICRGWEDAPRGSVVQLRLLGGLFRIVLTGRAPELVPFYPSLGGDRPPDQAWPVVRAVLAAHVEELHDALEIAPQTNEIGRTTALVVGLFEAVRRSGLSRVRLLEPGASAGLNLLVDRVRFEGDGWSCGPAESPLVLADCFEGRVEPAAFTIVERRGCDLSPVDPTSDEGALRLRSFVWPFHPDRHARLEHALELARRTPVTVDRAGAGAWLRTQLATPPPDDVLTVVWQSITRQYWPAPEVEDAQFAIHDAAWRMPVGWVSMEYPSATATSAVVTLSGLAVDGSPSVKDVHLGRVGDHGIPMIVEHEAGS